MRGPQHDAQLRFIKHGLEERVSMKFFFEVECQVKRGKIQEDLGRIHVIKEMTDESECWQ